MGPDFPANVFSSQNVGEAYLHGFNGSLQADVPKNFVVSASYNYTHGSMKTESGPETPLDHILQYLGVLAYSITLINLSPNFSPTSVDGNILVDTA
jgi:outer membrane receptor for ferrienterochelin and colicin